MGLDQNVSITIKTTSPGLAKQSYGVMLLLGVNCGSWGALELTRSYGSISEVVVDFATTTPEYKALQRHFQQNASGRRPKKAVIGKLSLKPTLAYTITPTAHDTTGYALTLNGTVYSITSGSSATATTICDALRTAIGSPSGITVGGTSTLTLTATTAGGWFSVATGNPDLLKVMMTHADPGVATDLAAILNADNSWYAIANMFNSEAMATAIAGWAETNGKLFEFATQDSEVATTTYSGATDVGHDLKVLAYGRSSGMYHPDNSAFMDLAVYGACLPFDPGTETQKFKKLVGVSTYALTSTHITNLKARNMSWFEAIGDSSGNSVGVTQGDWKVFGGEYIDNVRGLDAFSNDVQVDVFNFETTQSKIPLDDFGINAVGGIVKAAGNKYVGAQGKPALFSSFALGDLPKAADISPSDRAARYLHPIPFSAQFAQAAHSIGVEGAVTS